MSADIPFATFKGRLKLLLEQLRRAEAARDSALEELKLLRDLRTFYLAERDRAVAAHNRCYKMLEEARAQLAALVKDTP